MATLQDMRSDAAKINIIPLQASVLISCASSPGGESGPQRRCVSQQATVTSSRDQRGDDEIQRPVHAQRRRLPITAVAHTSSTAIVPQRRRGHSSPAASNAQLAANMV